MRDDGGHVEQVFHIEEMKGELEDLAHGHMLMHSEEALPPDLEEQFLESVLAFERAEQITHKELLARDDVAVPAPEELQDEELALKLIEVIHTLAAHRIFLESTNHLSDRELYHYLWDDALNEWGPDLPPDNPMNCHLDLVGSGSEEHTDLWLKYYADDATRARWAIDFPEMMIPEHVDPPYDRDRHLPKAPEPEPPTYEPEEIEDWWSTCREKLEQRMAEDGIVHGTCGDEPLSYCMQFACVCAVEAPEQPGTVGWWAISGDLPTTYLPAAEIPDPREFLRTVSRRWSDAVEAMESGDAPGEATIGHPGLAAPHSITALPHLYAGGMGGRR